MLYHWDGPVSTQADYHCLTPTDESLCQVDRPTLQQWRSQLLVRPLPLPLSPLPLWVTPAAAAAAASTRLSPEPLPSMSCYSFSPPTHCAAAASSLTTFSSNFLLLLDPHLHVTNLLHDTGFPFGRPSEFIPEVQALLPSSALQQQLQQEEEPRCKQREQADDCYDSYDCASSLYWPGGADPGDASRYDEWTDWEQREMDTTTRSSGLSTHTRSSWRPSYTDSAACTEDDEGQVRELKRRKVGTGDKSGEQPDGERSGGWEERFRAFVVDSHSRYQLYNRIHDWTSAQPNRPLTGDMQALIDGLSATLPCCGGNELPRGDDVDVNVLVAGKAEAVQTDGGVVPAELLSPSTPRSVTNSRRPKRAHSSSAHSDSGDSNGSSSSSSSCTLSYPYVPSSSSSSCSLSGSSSSKPGVINSGRVSPGWQHRSMASDFPFPIPPVFIYRHRVRARCVQFESHGYDKCKRCTASHFTSPSNAEAHHQADLHGSRDPLFVRYDDRSGLWEWFRRNRRPTKPQ